MLANMLSLIGLTSAFAISALFLIAAYHKLFKPADFAETLKSYHILPLALIGIVAPVLMAVEAICAVLLWFPLLRFYAALVLACLLLVYAAAIAWNLLRGRTHIDCGCNGPGHREPISYFLVFRNIFLSGLAWLVAQADRLYTLEITVFSLVLSVLLLSMIYVLRLLFRQIFSNKQKLQKMRSQSA